MPSLRSLQLAACTAVQAGWLQAPALTLVCGCAGAERTQPRTVVVLFIGGVTFAEIAGLRWLSSRSGGSLSFVVATTKLLNGRTLLESFFEPDQLAALQQRSH